MKNWTLVLGVLALGLLFPRSGDSAVISYTVANIDALLEEGVIDGFSVANLIQGNSLDVMTGVGESTFGGDGFNFINDITRRQAGSAADNRWIQTDNDEVWDLGFASQDIVVANSFDHDRTDPANQAVQYLEALEFTAWGSNDPLAAFGGQLAPGIWELARITAVYEDGYTFVDTWDDFTPVLSFSQSYRYVHVIAQNSIEIGGLTSGDDEINFVAGFRGDVPVPGTLTLIGFGLMGIGVLRRRQ